MFKNVYGNSSLLKNSIHTITSLLTFKNSVWLTNIFSVFFLQQYYAMEHGQH